MSCENTPENSMFLFEREDEGMCYYLNSVGRQSHMQKGNEACPIAIKDCTHEKDPNGKCVSHCTSMKMRPCEFV